jgi:hypothetical protein
MVHGKQRKYLVGAAVALALVATLVVAAVGAEASGSQSNADATHVHTGSERGASALTKHRFHDAMRKLWEDHVTWTRLFIVSFAADLPDLGPRPIGSCRTRSTSAIRSGRSTEMPPATVPRSC